MIEIRYRTHDNQVTGWCKDPASFGDMPVREGEAIVQWDTDTPGSMRACTVDFDTQTIILDPDWQQPAPTRIFWACVAEISPGQERPLRVTRVWKSRTYTVDCYITQDVIDIYQAGNLAVGDYVLVMFVDGHRAKPLATQKVYKSW